jgi:glycosyltransferase involved in cell wall biosynthesis
MIYPAVSLVIPCYNEVERLPVMFAALDAFASSWAGDFEWIIVNDGSTDGTEAAIQAHPIFQQWSKHICLLTQHNGGKGSALQLGVSKVKYPFFVTLDADMATHPKQLIQWLTVRKTFHPREILIGSRELQQSEVTDYAHRKLAGHVFNFLIRKITGLPYRDTQCGYKLYPEQAKLCFAALETKGWAHDVELLLRANRAGFSIQEMPVQWKAVDGSKISVWRDSWMMLYDVLRIAIRLRLQSTRP